MNHFQAPATRVGAATRMSRRKLLQCAAASATLALPAAAAFAQRQPNVSPATGRIDVHHHLYPPEYLRTVAEDLRRSGFNPRPWTPSTSVEMMDEANVATAIVSPVQRVVMDTMSDKSERARRLARINNEYGAKMVRDFPSRFGMFAALPLPDADGSLREAEYALDTLHADGIALWTSYLDKWVGDPAFWPVYEELNRRSAVVFVHPARASCCRGLPGQSGIIEYDIDTARAIDSLLWQGTAAKFPNIRFIFVHSAGAMSVLAARVIDDFPKNRADRVPNGVEHEIRKLYFDIAHASKAPALDALRGLVPVAQILYGSDGPLRGYELTDEGLDSYTGFSPNDLQAINRGNAERLFPRLKSA